MEGWEGKGTLLCHVFKTVKQPAGSLAIKIPIWKELTLYDRKCLWKGELPTIYIGSSRSEMLQIWVTHPGYCMGSLCGDIIGSLYLPDWGYNMIAGWKHCWVMFINLHACYDHVRFMPESIQRKVHLTGVQTENMKRDHVYMSELSKLVGILKDGVQLSLDSSSYFQ